MNRTILASLFLGCSLVAGCTDVDPVDTTTQALASACPSGIQFNGHWPTIGKWTGQAPAPVSAKQYFLIAPIDQYGKQYLVVQTDWESGKITWAVKISASQKASVVANLSVQPGNIAALGGLRPPIKYPPGTDEGQWAIDQGALSYKGPEPF